MTKNKLMYIIKQKYDDVSKQLNEKKIELRNLIELMKVYI